MLAIFTSMRTPCGASRPEVAWINVADDVTIQSVAGTRLFRRMAMDRNVDERLLPSFIRCLNRAT